MGGTRRESRLGRALVPSSIQASKVTGAREVVFRPQADDEVLAVRQWDETKRSGLGQEFSQELDALVARLGERPLAFPRVHDETRRAVLRRFPYAIYFRLADELVVVLALHGRQRPSRWHRRL